MGMAGLGSILNTTASNTIQAMDFTKLGTSDWFNTNQFTSSMKSASTWGKPCKCYGWSWSNEWDNKEFEC